MAELDRPEMKVIPAPYIACTAGLIKAASNTADGVFYRTGSEDNNGSIRDFFSAGPFIMHQCPWSEWRPDDDNFSKFCELRSSSVPLAGYLTYEAGFAFEHPWANLPHPNSGYAWRFAELSCWYEADHAAKQGCIKVTAGAEPDDMLRLSDIINQAECYPSVITSIESNFDADLVIPLGECTQTMYEDTVRQILEDIMSGRYYELNFTQRFHVASNLPPSDVFVDLLSTLNPKRGFYSSFSGSSICSLSPELYLNKSGNVVSTRPVKGSMIADVPHKEWEKLHAEHVMVVDLARNDLGRISDLGPVHVQELAAIKKFGGLQHLESSIYGNTSFEWPEIIAATFPAASITGAPKVEVVKAISQYEASPRGIYTGTCGLIWPDGDLDLNVAIRTATAEVTSGGWKYELGAGGAIVADSDPAAEYCECLRKVFPLVSHLLQVNN